MNKPVGKPLGEHAIARVEAFGLHQLQGQFAGIVRASGERSGADRPRLAPSEHAVGIDIARHIGRLAGGVEYPQRGRDVSQV